MTRIFLSLIIYFTTTVWADSVPKVPIAVDLSKDALTMSADALPMVVEMAADYCSYCKLIEEKVLIPMIISGDYESKALLRQVDIGQGAPLIDFSGEQVSQREFASRYKIAVTPTVLFLNQKGVEIAPRITGVPLIDYYAVYVDDAIALAQARMQAQKRP